MNNQSICLIPHLLWLWSLNTVKHPLEENSMLGQELTPWGDICHFLRLTMCDCFFGCFYRMYRLYKENNNSNNYNKGF